MIHTRIGVRTNSDLVIDCRLWNSTGIGRYIREVVPRVISELPAVRFLLVGPESTDLWARGLLQDRVILYPCTARVFRGAEQSMFRKVLLGSRLLWCPHFCVPLYVPRPALLLTTLHDLIPIHIARGWKGRLRKWGAGVYLQAVKRQAARVLTPSVAVANQLESELGFQREKLRPIPLGVAATWFMAANHPPTPEMSSRGGFRYLLYVGNISPHKNIDGLLRAFSTVVSKVPHRLVVLGEKRGFTAHARLAEWVRALDDRVVFLSRLTEAELQALVAEADLLVQPSLEEGFGLPPLEAMAARCPVLSSDAAALVETTGPGAYHFKLGAPDDMAEQLERLLLDTPLRMQRVDAGQQWARQFTWEKTAEQTAQVIRELLS